MSKTPTIDAIKAQFDAAPEEMRDHPAVKIVVSKPLWDKAVYEYALSKKQRNLLVPIPCREVFGAIVEVDHNTDPNDIHIESP